MLISKESQDRFLHYSFFFLLGVLLYGLFPRDVNIPGAHFDSYIVRITDNNGYVCIHTNYPREDNCQ